MQRRLIPGVLVVVLVSVGLYGVPHVSADNRRARAALIGGWKAAAENDPSTTAFLADGSWALKGGTISLSGTYVWADDGSVKMRFTDDDGAESLVWRVQIAGDVMQTSDRSGTWHKWIRVGAPTSTASPTQPVPSAQPARTSRADVVDAADVTASAPTLLRPSDLGRPVDADFRLLSGATGSPMYRSQSGDTSNSALNQDFLQVTDARDIAANADWWGIGGNVGSATGRRYLRYRAYQQTDILNVDDTAEVLHDPPSNAAWYVAAIVMGRSYEEIVSGDSSRFTAGVEAKLHVFGASVQSIVDHAKLQLTIKARGIVDANDKAIFASSANEIISAYRQGTAVPIYVVYRHIPGRAVRPSQPIAWVPEDNVKVDADPIACTCATAPEPIQVDAVCRVRNLGARAVEVTLALHAVTGSALKKADTTGHVRVAPNQTVDVSMSAPIQTSWAYHCDSLASCACEFREVN